MKNRHQFHELHEIAADNSGFVQFVKLVAASFVQLVEFMADFLMPLEQQSFVASHRQRRWFTLMELPNCLNQTRIDNDLIPSDQRHFVPNCRAGDQTIIRIGKWELSRLIHIQPVELSYSKTPAIFDTAAPVIEVLRNLYIAACCKNGDLPKHNDRHVNEAFPFIGLLEEAPNLWPEKSAFAIGKVDKCVRV
jgi:hypothetical protein